MVLWIHGARTENSGFVNSMFIKTLPRNNKSKFNLIILKYFTIIMKENEYVEFTEKLLKSDDEKKLTPQQLS